MFFLKNPRYTWLILAVSLVYLVSPFDLLPDFFPFLGQIDDLLLLTIMVSNLVQNLPKLFSATNTEKEEDIKTIDVDASKVD